MGNQKFKLSDMVPNAWFYKLKDMTKPSKMDHSFSSYTTSKLKKHRLPPPPPPSSPPLPPPEQQCQPRKSYHFTRDLTITQPLDELPISPPRKSKSSSKSRKSSTRKPSCTCRATATLESHRSKSPPSVLDTDQTHYDEKSPTTPLKKAGQFEIFIDDDNYKYKVLDSTKLGSAQLLESLSTNSYKIKGFDFQLPRIITKQTDSPPKPRNSTTKEEKPSAPTPRRFSVSSPAGIRLKINSPRIMARKQGQNGNGGRKSVKKRRSLSESFAVVKSSNNPQKDFKESMVEMIVQNNLRASKDLEDLLACYLSLNSDEYHDVIIKVFKQIWFDLSDIKHKKLVS